MVLEERETVVLGKCGINRVLTGSDGIGRDRSMSAQRGVDRADLEGRLRRCDTAENLRRGALPREVLTECVDTTAHVWTIPAADEGEP